MDADTQAMIAALGGALRNGASRADVVEELHSHGWDPQAAQNAYTLAHRWRMGQGDLGYQRWFWSTVAGRSVAPRASAPLWIIIFVMFLLGLPLSFAFFQSLPNGRYPGILIALPAFVVAFGSAQVLALPLFYLIVRRNDSND